jgi:DHA1 family bicyclomycin/chloramphenicol resistance-like MFS transporter
MSARPSAVMATQARLSPPRSARTPVRPLRPGSVSFTLLLSVLVTLASFATDMGLPVLAATAASLGVVPGRAALTLSVFMAGFALGPLVVGPLSDHYGRRRLLLVGCATFAVGGALAAFSTTLSALLVWRTLMGVGAGACQVLAIAIVRDLFAGPEARVRQSYVNLAAGLAPVLAPSLGVVIADMSGWRAIYGVLAGGGLALLCALTLLLGESAPRRAESSLTLAATLRSYARVVRHRVSFGYVLVQALNFGALFAYVSGSSLVLIELLHVGQRAYGVLFACTAFGLMAGAFLNAQLIRRGVSSRRLIACGLAAIVGSALLLLALTLARALAVSLLVPLAVAGFVGQGMVRPHTAQGALEPVPEIAGVASAVLSAVQMVAGAAASAVVAALFDETSALAMTAPMAICAVAAAAVYVGGVRRAENALRIAG